MKTLNYFKIEETAVLAKDEESVGTLNFEADVVDERYCPEVFVTLPDFVSFKGGDFRPTARWRTTTRRGRSSDFKFECDFLFGFHLIAKSMMAMGLAVVVVVIVVVDYSGDSDFAIRVGVLEEDNYGR